MRSLAFAALILSLLGTSAAEAQQAPARPSQDGKGDAPGATPGRSQPSSEIASLRATVAKQKETIEAQRRYIAGLERSNEALKQQLAAAAKP